MAGLPTLRRSELAPGNEMHPNGAMSDAKTLGPFHRVGILGERAVISLKVKKRNLRLASVHTSSAFRNHPCAQSLGTKAKPFGRPTPYFISSLLRTLPLLLSHHSLSNDQRPSRSHVEPSRQLGAKPCIALWLAGLNEAVPSKQK